MVNSMKTKIILFFLIIAGFFYRLYGLGNNYSFWTDEGHAAVFARAILEQGKPVLANGYHTGAYQWLLYWLGAISARIFGLSEFAIRFPSVIFGVLTIWAVYLLGRELFANSFTSEESKPTFEVLPPRFFLAPLLAAFLIAFLKIEILWSRQARPYQALQFFYLLGAYFSYKIAGSKKLEIKNVLGFLASGILASLTHGLGLVVFFDGLLYLGLTRFKHNKRLLFLIASLFILFSKLAFALPIKNIFFSLGSVNNMFYYRVFLTHNYLPLTVLAGLGGLFLLIKIIRHSEFSSESILKRVQDDKKLLLFVIFLGVQGFIVSFLLGQPFVRYFYIVFPFIILLASYGLIKAAEIVKRGSSILLIVATSLLIFGMRDKFAFLPQKTYSLNEDMQEVPEVDWKKIYKLVGEKLEENPGAVLITNWNDLPIWHLGEGRLDYLARKDSREIDPVSGARHVNTLEKFQEIVKSKKSGIVILDSWDNAVPEGIREYCHENLKREFEIDRLYPVQPRYWTVWVYSWGLK